MKSILLILFLLAAPLFAQRAPFAAQSDQVADLSDSLLNGIFYHRLGYDCCVFPRSVWVTGFGSYRERSSTSRRSSYDDWLGGILGGFNYSLSRNSFLNFFVGGSWGGLDIRNEPPHFKTDSILFGMTWEHLYNRTFLGLAIAGGVLCQKRTVTGPFGSLTEKPEGVFFTPELTYAFCFDCLCFRPLLNTTLRYAGFFSRDYQHRLSTGTLFVKDRSIQFFTLRGDLSLPLSTCYLALEPYLGFAGRFQFDGNTVHGRLLLSNTSFSQGIDRNIGYGLLGLCFSRCLGRFDLQGNFEGNYDTDESWRILGELTLNYAY